MIYTQRIFGKKEGTEISDYDGGVIAELRKALKGHSYQVTIEKRYIIVRVKREG